jgi:predicted PurR-regulated permease PerM
MSDQNGTNERMTNDAESPSPSGSPVPWWGGRPGRAALAALMLFALGDGLRIARPLLLPVVLALLLAVVLAPMVRLLHRLRLPYPLAAGVVVAAFAGAVGFGVYALADPAANWIERAPETMRDLERRLRKVKASMLEAQQAAEKVEAITRVEGSERPPEVTVEQPSLAARMVTTTQAALLHAVEVMVLLYFLLAFGASFLRRLVKIPPRLRAKIHIVKMTLEIDREISHYLLTIACINAGLGTATTVTMWALGMPNPVLWGVLAAVLNFVPYLGSACTLVILTVVAILTFETFGQAALVPVAFLVLATLEGQLINPIIVGRRMSLSPPAIVIALMVGAWIWGVVGLLIAVPVLVIVKIYCAHSEDLAPFGELLGRD